MSEVSAQRGWQQMEPLPIVTTDIYLAVEVILPLGNQRIEFDILMPGSTTLKLTYGRTWRPFH